MATDRSDFFPLTGIGGSGRGGGERAGMRGEGSDRGEGGPARCTERRLLAGTLGSRGCNAFLFFVDFAILARQEAHVLSSLLAGLDGSEREQESRRL